MREISLDNNSPDFVRALLCGLAGSGKTHMAATAPRPLFISDAAEGGYKTIKAMDKKMWWDPKVPPVIHAIERFQDVIGEIVELERLAALARVDSRQPFPYGTVVFDPLSIYVDRYLAENMLAGVHKDPRQYYGDLATHLRSLVLRFHSLPCHILWLCHVKADGTERNGPAIGGQMAEKLPAFMDFKWLCNVSTVVGQAPTYELRTQPYRTWTFLGSRSPMPDPFYPSFKCVADLLGLTEKPVSMAVPGFPDFPFLWRETAPVNGAGKPAAAAAP